MNCPHCGGVIKETEAPTKTGRVFRYKLACTSCNKSGQVNIVYQANYTLAEHREATLGKQGGYSMRFGFKIN